jgi:hypothetical protein
VEELATLEAKAVAQMPVVDLVVQDSVTPAIAPNPI